MVTHFIVSSPTEDVYPFSIYIVLTGYYGLLRPRHHVSWSQKDELSISVGSPGPLLGSPPFATGGYGLLG